MLYSVSGSNLDRGILLVMINNVWAAIRYDNNFVPHGANAACRAMGYTQAKSVSKTISKIKSEYTAKSICL